MNLTHTDNDHGEKINQKCSRSGNKLMSADLSAGVYIYQQKGTVCGAA
jgi:hypothetical protein